MPVGCSPLYQAYLGKSEWYWADHKIKAIV
jgi:hypothetical protein